MFWIRCIFCVFGLLLCPLAWADQVTIGAEDDAAPWSYLDGSGYVNDLVRAAYQAVHWEVKYEVYPYARCKRMVEDGRLVACFSASKTPELEQKLQYPDTSVFAAQNLLFVRSDSPLPRGCNSKAWGRKISVGFVNEYEYLPAVEVLQKSGTVAASTTVSEVLSLRMLDSKRFDAALITVDPVKRIELMAALAKVKSNFRVLCDFGGFPAYVAFSRVHPQATTALDAFNKGMKIITKDGTVQRLQKAWAKRALATAAAKYK